MTHNSVWQSDRLLTDLSQVQILLASYYPIREINAKDVNTILGITKTEAFDMRKLGFGNYIKKSYSSNPHYYLVEDSKIMKAYQNYKKSKIVK